MIGNGYDEADAIRLLATGSYIPEGRMTSADIARASGIPQEIVGTKLGMKQKPVPGPEDHPCEMGVRAARQALARAAIDPGEIDLVIYIGEEHKEYPVWTAALKLQDDLGAGAAYPKVMETVVITDGSFAEDVIIQAGGTKRPLTAELIAQGEPRFRVPDPGRMKSRLDAVSMARFTGVVERSVRSSGWRPDEIDFIGLLHMKRSAHEAVLRALGIPARRSVYLDEFGHIGLCIELGVQQGLIRPGSVVVLAAAGIGYAWGALTLKWGESV
ncbi:hypothetical protein J6TS7_08360 [Paenibacillus dendritiformis]|uniref:3-oxoacyl-[acyl-carrier-protein] synthase III C-terminal domain-containing protein n=1 Tax=Paenibacillus TaxID=44249 RepID=UPI001B2A059C|nr:3-oxoacyl-[acyl-carrier-protein] synthase III C-terminal domain-containing protein [Paenibacillus dendritiformis]MEB9894776.1 3-oxoacyl-[acyl-carrier-protein] synthase III C-terminal domain-containing protein [Bacillus cereus]GIO77226.1 hypothetical protein J6TS7_08360 [Paenibacillus dendritiformis]